MRGTGGAGVQGNSHVGITPACAGNSYSVYFPLSRRQDHPRVCGEQFRRRYRLFRLLGSPPRVRGTVQRGDKITQLVRITPACAGNSPARRRWRYGSGDHPRVCGEQWLAGHLMVKCLGSPPRVRGTAQAD